MAQVYKRAGSNGKAVWYIRYRDPSRKDIRKATSATTQRAAELILAEELRDIGDGIYEARQKQREVMFFDICEDFLTYGHAHKKSWRRDKDSIKHLKEFFGDIPAINIKPSKIEEYIINRKNSLSLGGKHPAPATINREVCCMKTIYNRAIRNEILEKNPVKHVKFLKENNKRDRVLSKEEFERLLQASSEHLKHIMIAAIETGMRAGEIFSLEWKQVDLKKGIITLQPEQTKTNEGRKIPISPKLYQTLTEIRKIAGPVFNFRGKSIGSVKNAFKQTCKRAGIKEFRFHDFRHTFVTNMRKAGKQDRVIMAITGHKTLSMLTRYDTVDEEDLLKAVA